MTKLHELLAAGQSVWLDYISRDLIHSGKLDEWIGLGLRGMTSNPKIFQQAISEGNAYDAQLAELAASSTPLTSALERFEALAVRDVQDAADHLLPIHAASAGTDGYISLEVNPQFAYDTDKTVAEAENLFRRVNRPNVMIKVPATSQGIVAVRQLIGQGININITLMFSLSHYNEVAQAYLDGLEAFQAGGGDVSRVASVASFFISRVDAKLDPILERAGAGHLKGKVAIAGAKQVYKRFQEMFSGARWDRLAAAGAKVQRPLWASTSTKNPDYPDTVYVDQLIGPDTVNTMPLETLDAFLDHGTVARTIDAEVDAADQVLVDLVKYGINLLEVGDELQREGVEKFVQPFAEMLEAIDRQTAALAG